MELWTQNRQYLLHDKSGTVLGFDTQRQLKKVLLSINMGNYSSIEEWWDEQNEIFQKALEACGHDVSKLKLPKEYVLNAVNFRHFCKHFHKKEA